MERISYKKNHSLGWFRTSEEFQEDVHLLGRVAGYNCYSYEEGGEDPHIWLEFTDPDYTNKSNSQKRACLLILTKTKRGVYEVESMVIDKQYTGLGLAPKYYAYILKKLNITIQAGEVQSPGGRSIWTRMAKRRDVLIYGKTPCGRPMMMEERDGLMQPMKGSQDAYESNYQMYAVRSA